MNNEIEKNTFERLDDHQKTLIQRCAASQFFILSRELDSMMKNYLPDTGPRYYYDRGEKCELLALRSSMGDVGPIVNLPTELTSFGLAELMKLADEKWVERKDSLMLSMLSSFFENALTKRSTSLANQFGKTVKVMEHYSDLWDVQIIPGELDVYGSKTWFKDSPYFCEINAIRQCIEEGVSPGYLRKIYTTHVLENISSHMFGIVKRLYALDPGGLSESNTQRMSSQSTIDDLNHLTSFLMGQECEDVKLESTLGLVGYLDSLGGEIPKVEPERLHHIASLQIEAHLGSSNDFIRVGASALKKQALENVSGKEERVNIGRTRLI